MASSPPSSGSNPNLDALDQPQVAEAVLGKDLNRLVDKDYIYQIVHTFLDEHASFADVRPDLINFIELIVAGIKDESERNLERDRLKSRLKITIFNALQQARAQIEANIKELNDEVNKAVDDAKRDTAYMMEILDINRNAEQLPSHEVMAKLKAAEDRLRARVSKDNAASLEKIDALKELLTTINVIPPYLRTFVQEDAQRKHGDAELKRRKEATKKGNLEPEEMVVKPLSEIVTAEDFLLADSKWGNVVTSTGLPPQAKPDDLFWVNKDGSINPDAIDDPIVVNEYWEFMQLKSSEDAMRNEFEHNFNNIVLDVDGLNDAELSQYTENLARGFIHQFLGGLHSGKGYAGLLMIVLEVNNALEATTDLGKQLMERALRQKSAHEQQQPKNWPAKPISDLQTSDDVAEAYQKWRHVVTQSGNNPTTAGETVYWVDSDGAVGTEPISDQTTLDEYWAYWELIKKYPDMHAKKVAAIKNIQIDYEGKSDAEIEEAIKIPTLKALKELLEGVDRSKGELGMMMSVLEANTADEAQTNMKKFVLDEIKHRIEEDRLRPRVKAELVAVNVEQKLRRVAEMLADERLDQEIKEQSLSGWEDLYKLRFVYKMPYGTMMRMAREGVREKYIEQFVDRLKKDSRMRVELVKLDRDETRTGVWNHVKQFFTTELPPAGALSEEMEGDLERIAERFGIGWQDENRADYLTQEESETLYANESLAHVHEALQTQLKGLCDAFLSGAINETEFKHRMKTEFLPNIQQLQDPPDATFVAYLESKTGLSDGDISKLGLLDKLKKHKEGLIRLDLDNIGLVIGQARNVHVATEVKSMSMWDRTSRMFVEGAQKNRVLNKFVSPTTVAIAGYAGSNALHMALTGTVPRVAGTAIAGAALGLMVSSSIPAVMAGIGVGCLAGGTYAYFRRNSEMMRVKAQKERRSAIGDTGQPDQMGLQGEYDPEDKLERRMEEKGTLYEKGDSLTLLRAVDENLTNYGPLLTAVADIVARNEISTTGVMETGIGKSLRKVDLIAFNGEQRIEWQRLMLLRQVATGKVALKGLADSTVPPLDWSRELDAAVAAKKKTIMAQIAGADKEFRKLKRRENLRAAGFGATVTGVIGGGSLMTSYVAGLLDVGFSETISLTPGKVDLDGLGKSLSAQGFDAKEIADIKAHLIVDPKTGQVLPESLEVLHDKYDLNVSTIAHEGPPGTSETPIADGAAMDKAKLFQELKKLNPEIEPEKVFDKYGHVDTDYLDKYNVKIDEIVSEAPSGGAPGTVVDVKAEGWEGIKQMEPAEYTGDGVNPDHSRFFWDGRPKLGSDGQYHFSIAKMFDNSLEHGSLPHTPGGMKVALEVQEGDKSVYKFFDVDNAGRIKIPSEYFGSKVGAVPKGSDVLPGLKTDSMVVGYNDSNGVFRTVTKMTGDGSYSVPTDQIVTGGDAVVNYKGSVVTQVPGEATVMASASTEQPLYGALIVSGAPSRHLEYGKGTETFKRSLWGRAVDEWKKALKLYDDIDRRRSGAETVDRAEEELKRRTEEGKKAFEAAKRAEEERQAAETVDRAEAENQRQKDEFRDAMEKVDEAERQAEAARRAGGGSTPPSSGGSVPPGPLPPAPSTSGGTLPPPAPQPAPDTSIPTPVQIPPTPAPAPLPPATTTIDAGSTSAPKPDEPKVEPIPVVDVGTPAEKPDESSGILQTAADIADVVVAVQTGVKAVRKASQPKPVPQPAPQAPTPQESTSQPVNAGGLPPSPVASPLPPSPVAKPLPQSPVAEKPLAQGPKPAPQLPAHEPVEAVPIPPTAAMIPPEAIDNFLNHRSVNSPENKQLVDEYVHRPAGLPERARYGLLTAIYASVDAGGKLIKTVADDPEFKAIAHKIEELANAVSISPEEQNVLKLALKSASKAIMAVFGKGNVEDMTAEDLKNILMALKVAMRLKNITQKPAPTLIAPEQEASPEAAPVASVKQVAPTVPETGPITKEQIETNALGLLGNMGIAQTDRNRETVIDYLEEGAVSKELYDYRFQLLPLVVKNLRTPPLYLHSAGSPRQMQNAAMRGNYDLEQIGNLVDKAGSKFASESERQIYIGDMQKIGTEVAHFFRKDRVTELTDEQTRIVIDSIWAANRLKTGGGANTPTPVAPLPDSPVDPEAPVGPTKVSEPDVKAPELQDRAAEFHREPSALWGKFINYRAFVETIPEEIKVDIDEIVADAQHSVVGCFSTMKTMGTREDFSTLIARNSQNLDIDSLRAEIRNSAPEGIRSKLGPSQEKANVSILAIPSMPGYKAVCLTAMSVVRDGVGRPTPAFHTLIVKEDSKLLKSITSRAGGYLFQSTNNIIATLDPDLLSVMDLYAPSPSNFKVRDFTEKRVTTFENRILTESSQSSSLEEVADSMTGYMFPLMSASPKDDRASRGGRYRDFDTFIARERRRYEAPVASQVPEVPQVVAPKKTTTARKVESREENERKMQELAGYWSTAAKQCAKAGGRLVDQLKGIVPGDSWAMQEDRDKGLIHFLDAAYNEFVVPNNWTGTPGQKVSSLFEITGAASGKWNVKKAAMANHDSNRIIKGEIFVEGEAEHAPVKVEKAVPEKKETALDANIRMKVMDAWDRAMETSGGDESAFYWNLVSEITREGGDIDDLGMGVASVKMQGLDFVFIVPTFMNADSLIASKEIDSYYDFVDKSGGIVNREKGQQIIRLKKVSYAPLAKNPSYYAVTAKKGQLVLETEKTESEKHESGKEVKESAPDSIVTKKILDTWNDALRENQHSARKMFSAFKVKILEMGGEIDISAGVLAMIRIPGQDFLFIVPTSFENRGNVTLPEYYEGTNMQGRFVLKKLAYVSVDANPDYYPFLAVKGKLEVGGITPTADSTHSLAAEKIAPVENKEEISEAELQVVTDMWNDAAKNSSNGDELYAQIGTLANTKGWIALRHKSQQIIELTNKKGVRVFVPGRPKGPVNMILDSWFSRKTKRSTGKWKLVRPAVVSSDVPPTMHPNDIVGELVKKGEFIPG